VDVPAPARLRMNRTALLPVGLFALCVIPLATSAPWTAVLLLLPLALALWVLRSGVDIADDGLTLRSLVGERRVAWSELVGIRVAARGELWLVTTGGTDVRVPVMRARDLPRLSALSGGRIDVPEPPAQ
jgi:hypothetical protein